MRGSWMNQLVVGVEEGRLGLDEMIVRSFLSGRT